MNVMPKQLLTGSLDEQCEFLYNLAVEKMTQGNFTGAVHALREVVKHRPEFRNAKLLLTEAEERRALQQRLLMVSLLGAVCFAAIGTFFRMPNDLFLLGWAVVGAFVGYGAGNWIESFRKKGVRRS